jgi:hypothetical protein
MEQKITSRGLKPQTNCIGNETSKVLKDYLHDQYINFQLIPPLYHWSNAA